MSEIRDDMLRTLDRIVEDHVTNAMREAADLSGKPPGTRSDATAKLWQAIEDAGFTAIGAGGDDDIAFADAMELVRRAAYHALPVPLAETIISRRQLALAGIEAPSGLITLAPPAASPATGDVSAKLSGTAGSVPFARDAAHALVATPAGLHLLAIGEAITANGANMAGEPRDAISLSKARVVATSPMPNAVASLEADGALIRAVQLSGALAAALDHGLTWVNDRVQFGKPIGKHQAVQHLMAQLAEEAAAGGAAADFAVEASAAAPDRFSIAVAKSRAGEAAGKGANIVHAAFGAMGFTREHALHYTSRRLWAWRNEFGAEVYWQAEIGRSVAKVGGRGLWRLMSGEH